jgi:hypothetical protein
MSNFRLLIAFSIIINIFETLVHAIEDVHLLLSKKISLYSCEIGEWSKLTDLSAKCHANFPFQNA